MQAGQQISRTTVSTKVKRQPVIMAGALLATTLLIWLGFWSLDLTRALDFRHSENMIIADWLAGTTEVVAGILAVAVTVVAIVVELASNRYSHRISDLFFNDRRNQLFLSWLALTTLLCLLTSLSLSSTGASNTEADHWFGSIGLPVLVTMIVLSIGFLIPYFFHVFMFLRPESIVQKIEAQASPGSIWRPSITVEDAQQRLAQVLGDLSDVAGSAIKNQDRGIVITTLQSLFGIQELFHHKDLVQPESWTTPSQALLQDPDFAAMSDSSIAEISESGLWLETKVLRQSLLHLDRALPHLPEVAHVLADGLIRLMHAAGQQPRFFSLVTRGFNSALRVAINKRDQRTGYYLLAHYRQAAEQALVAQRQDWALEISGHLAFYGQLAFETKLPFLLEVAAHDQVELIRSCTHPETTQALLNVLLEMDQPIVREPQAEGNSLLAVRRAQIRVATHFLSRNEENLYQRVRNDLASEQPDVLKQLISQLENETRSEYWEFTDRGMNFGFLPAHLRVQLARLSADLFG